MPLRPPLTTLAGAASLVLGGVLVAIGGLWHPHVPEEAAAEMATVAESAVWTTAHWMLTLSQPLVVPGLLVLARRLRRGDGRDGLLWWGASFLVIGAVVGALGTLAAATALHAAAEAGDAATYRVVASLTLGIGWLCIAAAGVGGALLATHALLGDRMPRALAAVALVVSLAAVAGAVVMTPSHPWVHSVLLKYGAVAGGALYASVGVWLAASRAA